MNLKLMFKIMIGMDFCSDFVQLILMRVKSVGYNVLVNSQLVGLTY